MKSKRAESSYTPKFDWAIYADATLAGLAQLIPIPFLDSVVEGFFRKRMPVTIAQRHSYAIDADAVRAINADSAGWDDWIQGCLFWPLRLLVDFLLRFVRKVVYFLTIKKAVDALNYYWQRAFLLDHMMRMEYVDDPAELQSAVDALERVLTQAKVSPLRRLARQLMSAPFRMGRSVWRAWRGQEDQTLAETRSLMSRTWGSFGDYFATLARRYDETYQAVRRRRWAADSM